MADQIIDSGSQGDEGKEIDYAAELEKLRVANKNLSTSVQKLEQKNQELVGEKRKYSKLERLLQAIDVDPNSEESDEALVAKLLARDSQAGNGKSLEGQPPGGSDAGDTSPESLDMKRQLRELQKKLADVEKKAQDAEAREKEAVEKRKRDYIELRVKEALTKHRCIQPNHLYRLKADIFRLSDDGETIIAGPEHDPRSLEDMVETLKDDPEFSMYFQGSGASGSGMLKGQTGLGGQSMQNPFRSDQYNGTNAALVFQRDQERAKRLILEARSAGKLDPRLKALVALAGV